MESIGLTPETVSKQQLLFGTFAPISFSKVNKDDLHASFANKGFVVLENLKDYRDAELAMRKFISEIDPSQLTLLAPFDNHIELAKVDGIPMCEDAIEIGCQALHFDYGQPLVSDSGDSIYLFVGLYRPANTEPTDAKTRIVFLPDVARQGPKMQFNLVKERLDSYVSSYGDGWKEPTPVNTGRIALFARVLDAIYGKKELLEERFSTMAQWFQEVQSCSSLDAEYEFFKSCGIDLKSCENFVTLAPGQLVIIDNIRCVHGRVGKREPEEIFQYLYGVKEASSKHISLMIDWLCGLFSSQ